MGKVIGSAAVRAEKEAVAGRLGEIAWRVAEEGDAEWQTLDFAAEDEAAGNNRVRAIDADLFQAIFLCRKMFTERARTHIHRSFLIDAQEFIKSAGVVIVAVRDDGDIDSRQVYSQSGGILSEETSLPHIEKHARATIQLYVQAQTVFSPTRNGLISGIAGRA